MSSTSTVTVPDVTSTPPVVNQDSSPITIENVQEGKVDTVDSNARYLAYFARIRPLLLPATRYLAYTSDIGEAFRPIVKPGFVTAAYGVSWLYLGGDVAYEGYKAHLDHRNALRLGIKPEEMASETMDVGLRVAKRAIFQSTASMLFPALTIHAVVRHSNRLVWSKSTKPFPKRWGATISGMAIVPFLPYLFDLPVERALDRAWVKVDEAFRPAGSYSVGHGHSGHGKVPEKEL